METHPYIHAPVGTTTIEWYGEFSLDDRLLGVSRLIHDDRGLTPERYDRAARVWRYAYDVIKPLFTGELEVERIDAATAATLVPAERMGTDVSYRSGPTDPTDPDPASVAALMVGIRARVAAIPAPPGWETLRDLDPNPRHQAGPLGAEGA